MPFIANGNLISLDDADMKPEQIQIIEKVNAANQRPSNYFIQIKCHF
jgi:hypothetical protein